MKMKRASIEQQQQQQQQQQQEIIQAEQNTLKR
jgi:hypothetical protein